jgi:hypothetical protein
MIVILSAFVSLLSFRFQARQCNVVFQKRSYAGTLPMDFLTAWQS